ncbi:ABC transporter substrate-binding protein [Neomegalonema perideroedes]|uniref:ABC transporter substrate-binding protein n=1 Tax=Neomegalonema perideroedes TaxID=217219 RepID=UPI00035CB18A|nr:ABC transporter substrate-binding protein [Neomegalonema perideroedes]
MVFGIRTAFCGLLGATALVAASSSAQAAGNLNLICSADVVVCELLENAFEQETGVSVNMVRLSSGETYAKLRAEARNPRTDVWWGGTGDPHLQAAADNLTQQYESPRQSELRDWAIRQYEASGGKTVGVYAGALGWGYNRDLLAAKGLEPPLCWADLLKPGFKGEIQIANPNSSGTAYTALASLVQIMGEDEAFAYQKALNDNVSQYTKSGSAPVKSAGRGETMVGVVFMHDAVAVAAEGFPIEAVAPCEGTGYEVGSMSIVRGARNLENAKLWYDWALRPDVQSRLKEAKSFQLPSNKLAEPPPEAPDFDAIKLIDYDFEKYGATETRRALLERWDKEIGASAQ